MKWGETKTPSSIKNPIFVKNPPAFINPIACIVFFTSFGMLPAGTIRNSTPLPKTEKGNKIVINSNTLKIITKIQSPIEDKEKNKIMLNNTLTIIECRDPHFFTRKSF